MLPYNVSISWNSTLLNIYFVKNIYLTKPLYVLKDVTSCFRIFYYLRLNASLLIHNKPIFSIWNRLESKLQNLRTLLM